ncbi:Eukaryotic translation initiation factor eIF-1 [Monascus purpureus]|uniref:Eukaryotic translation initiation factor eIF-1 n=2 Tax=Monascus purpureus TaxID=5098 RepID=A0A507QKZ2_MONPU|nr:Eukaryotic translation initiation factor eIF-1 [Monascus purpureus]
MASKKDMRRVDLVVPYVDPPKDKDNADMSGAMTSTLPMAAMFTRNRMIGWVSFVFALQNWLAESPDQKETASTPGYMSVFMSLMALVVVEDTRLATGSRAHRLPPQPLKKGLLLSSSPFDLPPSSSSNYSSLHFLRNPYSSAASEIYISDLVSFITTTFKGQLPEKAEFMSIENLKTFDPFAEADEDTGETKQSQNYIHIRIQQRNGRKTLTTVQGLPKKFDQKKILKVIKKKFACNGTIVHDSEMGEVIQLQGDQRKDVQEFLTDKKEGLELDAKTIKVHGF